MEIKLFFGIISSIIAVVCFIPYFRDIFKKKTQPHAYSWLIWSILQAVGMAAQLKDGAGYGTWALLVGAVLCFAVFLLSFKYGTKNIKKFDSICLFAALIAIIFYFVLENPLWTVVLVVAIDFVGYLPTFRKGFEEPLTETTSTYVLSALSNIFSLLALQNYTITTIIYLAVLLPTNSSFAIMIMARKKFLGIK